MNSILPLAKLCLTCAITLSTTAADWPQFRGPQRNAHSSETDLAKTWPAAGPALLWSTDKLGLGYSGPAIVGNRLYICVGRGDSEFLVAFDIADKSPRELWATRIGPLFTWKGNNWNIGPNITPTVDGDLIFALGGFGDLLCANAQSGKELWRKNLPKELAGEVNPIGGGLEDPTPLGWGYAWAPLVEGDQLICVPGGKQGLLASLDKKTGVLLWRSKEATDQAPYSSPIAVDVGGIRQILQACNSGVVGVNAKDGKQLWSYRRAQPYDDVVTAAPIFSDNHVFTSVGFGQGCDLIKLTPAPAGITVEKVYSNKTMQSRDGGVVLVDGHLYGYSEGRGWTCVEMKTGKVKWADKDSLGRGSVMYADGNLYCCAEKGGIVAMIQATPNGWTEKGRLTLPRESTQRRPAGGMWTHPAIANARLYLRDQEWLYCYDLK